MTIEFITTLVLLLGALIALDYLLLLARREPNQLPFANSLFAQWKRLAGWWQRAWPASESQNQEQERLAVSEIAPSIETKSEEEAAASHPARPGEESLPEAESITSEAPTPEHEIPVAGGKVARIRIEAEVPANTVLHITITTDREGRAHVQQEEQRPAQRRPAFSLPRPPLPKPLERIGMGKPRFTLSTLLARPSAKLSTGLFIAALAVYLLTRLIGLADFPIYFFGDEAIQTSSASSLLERGMRGPDGTLLPTYFQNGQYFNLSVSVYLQVLPQLLFGKSVFVTRAASVLVTLLAATFVGLMLRDFFDVKRWWLATILLSVIPAWFLHSRTAFETVLFVSFYATFLYFYLEYRLRNPNKVYWAVIFAGLSFYSYSPGQLVLAVTGILLLLSDLKYHWQQRVTLVKAVALLALVAIPYIRFRLFADYSPLDHLRSLGSYWIQPTPLPEKLARFFSEYLRGLSPSYWFFDAPDMARHQMRGYGNIPVWFAPFMLAGIVISLLHWRSPAHRLALLAALAAPSGAALAEIGITRILVFVIPASLLTTLGLDWAIKELETFLARLRQTVFPAPATGNILSLVTFTLVAAWNVAMLTDALKNGPTWYTDYGLYGMQYGARQVFQETVVPALQQDPEAYFVVTPSWANGAEHFVGFFVPKDLQPRIALGQAYDFIKTPLAFTEKNYFVVTYQEYEKISADPKFKQVTVRSTIPYPDGRDGFYIINLKLADNIQEILAKEDAIRRTPVEETVEWMGQSVRVVHSPLGGGRFADLVDGDVNTLAKGEQANPIVYEMFFSQPISASELVLTTGSMRDLDVVVNLYPVGESTPVTYSNHFTNLPDDPTFSVPFTQGPAQFDRVYLSLKDNNQGEFAQVHIREIEFR